MRYNYYEPVVVNEIESAVAVVFMVIYGIIFTAMAVLTIIGMWKVFQKN